MKHRGSPWLALAAETKPAESYLRSKLEMLLVKTRHYGCLVIWCCVLPLFAQQSPRQPSPLDPVFRAETVLMEVEVKVTDKQGRPVPDLKPEDFTLLENGEAQVIRTFEYVTDPGNDAAGPESSDPERNVFGPKRSTEQDSLPRGTTWIYVTGRIHREDRNVVWRQMEKFLDDNLQPGVLVSVSGSKFTSKRPDLDAELRKMVESGGDAPSLADLDSGIDTVRFGEIEYDPQFQARVNGLNEAFADVARQQVLYSGEFFLYAYIDLVKSLSVLPGKKVVVLFLSGLGKNEDLLRRLVAEAARARVTFYVVETNRLSAAHPYIPDATFGGYQLPEGGSVRVAINSADTNVPSPFKGLHPRHLAGPTGGKAATNVLGLGRILTNASESLRSYYVLGYSPREPDMREGERKIRIQVNRPGLTLDYRKQYYVPTRFDRLSRTEKHIELHHYLKYDVPFTDIPLTLAYDFFRGDDGEAMLYASVGVHSSHIPLAANKKRSDAQFVAAAQALDIEGKKGPAFAGRNVRIRASSKYLNGFQQNPSAVLHIPIEMKLSPGSYDWKVVLRDEKSGNVGSYKTRIVVPEFSGEGQSSSLLLTGCYSDVPAAQSNRRGGSSSKISEQRVAEGVLGDGRRFYTDASHTYRKGDPIYLVYDLYDVRAEEESALPPTKLTLMRGQQRVDPPQVTGFTYRWRPERSDVRYMLSLDSNELEPGDYQLLAVMPNGKEAIYRDFRVLADKSPDLWLDPDYGLMGCGIQ